MNLRERLGRSSDAKKLELKISFGVKQLKLICKDILKELAQGRNPSEIKPNETPDETACAMLIFMAKSLQCRDFIFDAMMMVEKAISIAERSNGPDHPDVVAYQAFFNKLDFDSETYWYHYLESYDYTATLHERSLAIQEAALDSDHPDVGARLLHTLAELHYDKGDYIEADVFYKCAITIKEKTLSPDHRDITIDLIRRANSCFEQGQYAEAEPLYKRSLEIKGQALGPEHPDVASILDSLARLYMVQGQYALAEPLFKRSLAILENVLDPDHIDVARVLNRLARLYDSQGQHTLAEPLYKRSWAIQKKDSGIKGPDYTAYMAELLSQLTSMLNPKTLKECRLSYAEKLHDSAFVSESYGYYTWAENEYKQVLAIKEHVFGPEHIDVAESLHILASLYDSHGKHAKAEPLFKRSLAIREKVLGTDHIDVAESLNSLVSLYDSQGQHALAEELDELSFLIQKKVFARSSSNESDLERDRATSRHDSKIQRQRALVEPLLNPPPTIQEKILDPDHIDAPQALSA